MQYDWEQMVDAVVSARGQATMYKERWRNVEAELQKTAALLMGLTTPGHEDEFPVDIHE